MCYVFYMELKIYIDVMKVCKVIWFQVSLVVIEIVVE